jgi:MFS family permease
VPGASPVRSSEPSGTPRPTLAGNAALGVTQIILWGGTFFLTAVISDPIVAATGWPQAMVVGALSLAIFVSGLPAPFVGRMIRRHGGRPVLIVGSMIVAAGLVLMAAAQSLPVFLLAWVIGGLGMSASLYNPLFAAIGQAYGSTAREAMTQIAISSGFAVSLCWPATRFLVDQVGWRGACLTYAILCVVLVAPLFHWALPSLRRIAAEPTAAQPDESAGSTEAARLPAERLLAVTFAVAAMIMTAASVQLLNLLQALGVGGTTAVALTGLIRPAQVGVRVVELAFGRRAHPAWSLLLSSASVGLGLLLLATVPSLAWLAMLLYGAGNGMRTVVRGTLPLALYGQREYAAAMGRLARLPLLGQAMTPLACGYVAEGFGLMPLLDGILAAAAINIGLSLWVFGFAVRRPVAPS